MALCRPSYRAC
ncbi:UNVERIFIED_CONTAM: hypothetical protein NCL1_48440 [Trichonephila clavipes]